MNSNEHFDIIKHMQDLRVQMMSDMSSMSEEDLADEVADIINSNGSWYGDQYTVDTYRAGKEIVAFIIALNNITSVIENLGG